MLSTVCVIDMEGVTVNQIIVASSDNPVMDKETLDNMFSFRHKVFYERLGWDVEQCNGRERDFYDDLNPVYMVAKNSMNEVEGCWRLLPTVGSYMRQKFLMKAVIQAVPRVCRYKKC